METRWFGTGGDGTWGDRGVTVGEELILHNDPRLGVGLRSTGRCCAMLGRRAVRGERRRVCCWVGGLPKMEYLTNCHHMGVSGNRFATHERGVNVRGIN
jgi:hypothetical protein